MFTLSCFLTKCVIPSLIVVRYVKERSSKMYEVEMFLGIVFICSMENVVCVRATSLVEKERSKETKWSFEKVEITACVVGRAREVCSLYGVKVRFAV